MTTTERRIRIPLPAPFRELLKPHRTKVFYGGRGGGKSWAFARALLILAMQSKKRIICAREFQNSIRESVHALLEEQIRTLGLEDFFVVQERAILGPHGSEFVFMGLKQNIHSAKSFEGADILWIEEGQTTSKESLDIIIPTIRKEGSEIWISLNLETEEDPVKTRFIDAPDPDVYVRKVNHDENRYMSSTLEAERLRTLRKIETAKSEKERAQAQADYDHVWLGFPKRLTDAMVLKRWEIREFAIPSNVRWYYGADWGFANDPTALVRCFLDGRNLCISDEAYGYKVELDETAKLFDTVPDSRRWPIIADSARPETISHMCRQGFRVFPAEKWPGSVEDGIAHLNSYERILIHPRCPNFADEARKYSYKVDRMTGAVLPVLVDKFNHLIDACILEGQLIHCADGLRPIESMDVGDLVLTRKGYKPVDQKVLVSNDSEVWELVTASGKKLLATGDHRVFVNAKGFTRIDALEPGDELLTIQSPEEGWERDSTQKRSNGTDMFIDAIRKALDQRIDGILRGLPGREARSISTGRFGSFISVLSHRIITFITKISIPQTTPSKILNAFHASNIFPPTSTPLRPSRSEGRTSTESGPSQRHGTHLPKDSKNTGRLAGWFTKILSLRPSHARHAQKSFFLVRSGKEIAFAPTLASLPGGERAVSITNREPVCNVQKHSQPINIQTQRLVADHVLCVRVTHIRGKVYDIAVRDSPEFFASGILVHNCRYALGSEIKRRAGAVAIPSGLMGR